MSYFKRVFTLLVLLALCSCQNNPTYETFKLLLPWTKKYAQALPGFDYILVSFNDQQTLMALGSQAALGDDSYKHLHEYWYNNKGEVLHIIDGRIHRAWGFTKEIRQQTADIPNWGVVFNSKKEFNWQRSLDLMPGFRYNLVEYITTYRIKPPKDLINPIIPAANWVADLVESKSADGRTWSYQQRFALEDKRVVYSEQCIDKSLCLKIRRLGIIVPVK